MVSVNLDISLLPINELVSWSLTSLVPINDSIGHVPGRNELAWTRRMCDRATRQFRSVWLGVAWFLQIGAVVGQTCYRLHPTRHKI